MTKIIEVIVAPNGATKIETKGFSGVQCQSVSRSLELAIGQPENEQLTGEFYAAQPTHHGNSIQQ